MSHHYHAIVWIDHHEARILEFNQDEADSEVVKPRHPVKHLHTKAGSRSSWRAGEDADYYGSVAEKLGPVHEVLIVGPANAKLAFMKFLQKNDPATADKIVGIESVDHPTDGQLVNFARNYFKSADRLLPQID
ncbi:MAG: translational machinery protein [Parvibaculaceae bacterium]|jgi:stalled ribosome rescue protein Dom34|nr:translational machinery protein [Kangiella sp.]